MRRVSTIEILGGGPAGLYTAILVRRLMPHVKVRVTEQNPRGATFGFGVVFSDRALEFLAADDPETHDLVAPAMERWRDMILHHPQGAVTLDGVGFSAIGRLKLIEILGARAEALGVTTRFAHPIRHLEELDGDLIVGADGLNSLVRRSDETAFAPHVEHFANYFAWFGTQRRFETLTQTFVRTDEGAFNAHHYRYAPEMSTFIVECSAETFERCRLADMDEAQSARACEEIFAEVLDGAPLVTNQSQWRRFPRLWCKRWISGNRVILGDAAHTAHFSIGSGTRLALEDALALVTSLADTDDLQEALATFQSSRRPVAHKIVTAANSSAQWYETFSERMRLPPLDFAFDYITRSGRIDMDRLRTLAPRFMARYGTQRAAGVDTVTDPVAPDAPGSIEIGFDRTRHRNCSAVLWDNLDRNPDKLAVTGPAGDLTYRELCARAAKWGNAFKIAGLVRGARIAFFLDDTPAYPAAFFGAVRAGFVPVLLNVQSRSDLLNYFLKDSNATLAICEASLASSFDAETLEGTSVERVVMVNGSDALAGMVPESVFIDGESDELACADTGSEDMAFWMYSSGSTGRPKGIVHLHHDMAYTHRSFGSHVLRLREDDRCFSVPKIFFAYGFGNSLTFPFSVGATTVLMSGRPEAGAVLDVIERFRPTVFFGLPTLYTALCRVPGIRDRDLGSLRQSMSAAEVLSEETYSSWKALAGHGPVEGLGSTEMLHIYLSNRLDDHRLGAAGARVPGYEVKLATPEGDPVRPGEEGVLLVRGDSSAPCYWRKPEKSRETMRDDWIDTGDRFVERDGYYYFRGRTDELVKISGQWVWPLEVERCLNEHPHVHECAVLATIAVFGFVEGVAVGMLATLALFVIRLSRVDVIAEEFTARDRRSTMLHSVPDRAILYDRGELLRGYRLRGYIFFGSAHPLIDELKRPLGESPPPSCILLDFAAVSGCDLSAVNVLCQFVQMAHRAGVRMVFSALSRQLEGSLRSNIPVEAREQIWFESDFDSGLERCEDLLITVAMRGPSGPKDDERGRLFERVAGKLERHLDEMVAFEELLERLEPWLEPCEYAQGETLSLQGEVRDGVQLLVSGLVSVHDAEGTRLHHCGPGDVLDPWAAFEDKNVASTTAIARTPCRTMMLTPVARASRVGRQRPDAEVLYLHYQSSAARRTGSGWRLNGRAEM